MVGRMMTIAVEQKGRPMNAIETLKFLLDKALAETPPESRLVGINVPVEIVQEIIDGQPQKRTDKRTETHPCDMKIGDRCFVHGYVDEIRKDTIIIRNNGGYFGTDPGEVIVVTNTAHPNWIQTI